MFSWEIENLERAQAKSVVGGALVFILSIRVAFDSLMNMYYFDLKKVMGINFLLLVWYVRTLKVIALS